MHTFIDDARVCIKKALLYLKPRTRQLVVISSLDVSFNLQCVCSPSMGASRINGRFPGLKATNHNPALCIVGMEMCDTTCLCVVISNGLRNKITIALKNGTELL